MLLLVFIFGLIIGSFINALVYRLRYKLSLAERSICPICKSRLRWFELIPVFSFLIQLGRCRKCKGKISWQYPVVELVAGALFSLTYLQVGFVDLVLVRDLFFISTLIVIFIYDLRWYLIPDIVSLPALAVILVLNIAILINQSTGAIDIKQGLVNLALGVLAGGGFFLLQFIVSKGRWIGGGDIRLGVLMGAMFAWPQVLWALVLAYLVGALISIFLILFKNKEWSSQIPFGTFLSVSSVAILLYGTEIINWYLGLITI